jgi:hypothetical protein
VIGVFRSLRSCFDAIRTIGAAAMVGMGVLLFFDRAWWLSVAAQRLEHALGLPS